jgi:hypothetical protein
MVNHINQGGAKLGDEIPQPVGVALGGNLRPSSQAASDHQHGSDPLLMLMRH